MTKTVDGTWRVTVTSPRGPMERMLALAVDGSTLTGSVSTGADAANGVPDVLPVENGRVDGDTLTFSVPPPPQFDRTFEWTATVDGDVISGTLLVGGAMEMPFEGMRVEEH